MSYSETVRSQIVEALTPREKLFSVIYGLLAYEQFWLPGQTYYEPAARIQSQLAGGIKAGDIVAEIGCGPGNSTAVLAASNPDFGRMFAIDPSHGFLRIAQYIFNKMDQTEWTKQIEGLPVNQKVLANLDRVKNQVSELSSKVEVIRSRGDQIPLAPNRVDRVHCTLSLHWMAYADNDIYGKDVSYLKASLASMRKVLKTGGLLIFDQTGYQLDFGDDIHWSKSPFYLSFLDHLKAVFKQKNLTFLEDKYSQLFSYEKLNQLLQDSGFALQSIDGEKYKVHLETRSEKNMLESIQDGGPMRHFNASKQLANLPHNEKMSIINQALKATLAENENLLRPSTETYAFFMAKAI